MRMRKLAVPTAALAAVSFAAVAPSYAQTPGVETTIAVQPKVSPNKAGTKKKPKSVSLDIKAQFKTTGPDGQNKPVAQKVEILFPKGSLYDGKAVPSCAKSKLDRGLPKDVCPKGSIVGSGGANAWADTVKTTAKFTLVNGGQKAVYLYTEMTNPAIVQTPVPGKIKKGGKLGGYVLTFTVPEELQIVGGVPISLIDLHVKTNKKAKGWLNTTSCTGGKWPFETTTWFDNGNQAKFASSVKCKK
ncbi:hypothetical protein ACVU7I_16000 [Patulibacter sp. S7RM1-6]